MKLLIKIFHVVLLDQAFAHCPRFHTAAPTKELDIVSVPRWLIVLPDQLNVRLGAPLPHQLPFYSLSPLYIAQRFNPLLSLSTILWISNIISYLTLPSSPFEQVLNFYFFFFINGLGYTSYSVLFGSQVLLTNTPLRPFRVFVQLACVKHTTSVHSEPGSNSTF